MKLAASITSPCRQGWPARAATLSTPLASFTRRADAPTAAAPPRTQLSLLRAVAGGDFLFRGVLGGGLFDHLSDHVAVARHERRDLLKAGTVPALEFHHARTFVVGTAGLDRRK